MEKELGKIHRLALPLIVKRKGASLIVSDGLFGHEFDFKDFGQLKVVSIDSEGFVTFEISTPQQQTLIESTLPRLGRRSELGSFVLLGTGTAKSKSGGVTRGTYEYFKRSTDEYYYSIHKIGSKVKKIHLGSLQESTSDIVQIIHAIRQLGDAILFDRKMLVQTLTPGLSHGQKLKSALDILVLEGFLERRESQRLGRAYEQYKATSKIQTIK